MKKFLSVLALSAAFFAAGCMQEIETGEPEDYVPQTELSSEKPVTDIMTETAASSAETFSDDLPGEMSEKISDENMHEAQSVTDIGKIEENSCEQFFLLFEGADLSDAYIGDSMKEVLGCINDDIAVKKLTKANIEAAYSSGNSGRTMFAFTAERSDGIIPVRSGGKTYYASGFTTSGGENFTAVFGCDESASPEEASGYISTCGRVDYLAVCADTGDDIVIMPIAAGNSRDGVYAVLPNARLMGYDMSGIIPFKGMSDSINIRIKRAAFDGSNTSLQLYYETDNSFTRNIYFECNEIFINGNPIPSEFGNSYPIILYDKGTIELKCPSYSEGDILYFKGIIFDSDTTEEICPVGTASYNIGG